MKTAITCLTIGLLAGVPASTQEEAKTVVVSASAVTGIGREQRVTIDFAGSDKRMLHGIGRFDITWSDEQKKREIRE